MLSDAVAIATIPCVDLAGMRQFYGAKLGLSEVEFPADDDVAQEATAYQFGQGSILFIYARPSPTQADHTAVTLVTSDFDGTIAELLGRGVEFARYDLPGAEWDDRGVASMGQLKSAWFADPEGNVLAVAPTPF